MKIIIAKQSHSNSHNVKSLEEWNFMCSSVHFSKVAQIKYIFNWTIKEYITSVAPPPTAVASARGFQTDQGRINQLPSSLLEVKNRPASLGLEMTTGGVTFSPLLYPIMVLMSLRMADRKINESFQGLKANSITDVVTIFKMQLKIPAKMTYCVL